VTNFLEQSPFWEAEVFLAEQVIIQIVWSPKIYYRCQSSLTLVHNLSQTCPVHGIPF